MVAEGVPEEVAKSGTYTGQFLKKILAKSRTARPSMERSSAATVVNAAQGKG